MAASGDVRAAPASPEADGPPPATTIAPEEMRDEELFARIAEGSGDAFDQLYRRYSHELYDFAARITHDREGAADIVQTVFATVWERTRRGERVRSPRAWLYRATHNAAIDDLRRHRRTAAAEGEQGFDFAAVEEAPSHEPARALIDKEIAEVVWSTAGTLKPDDYALLDLYVRRELSPAELADELGITTGAVHTRLSRLRRSFEEALTVKLLTRRAGKDCDELAYLVSALGERAESDEGRRLLRAHIRDCPACQESRRRYVTAEAVLAALTPVPFVPGLQAAIWSRLAEVLGLGAGGGAAEAGGGSAAPPHGHGSVIATAAAQPVVGAAAVLATLAVVGLGIWAGSHALLPTRPPGAARDPSGFSSLGHKPGEPSGASRITIVWSRQPDAVSYSVLWSHAPRDEPDTVPDLRGSATRTTSPVLAPGRWWFHLRTEGRNKSWTHTVHLGPFVITAPSGAQAGPARPRPGGARPGAAGGAAGSGGGQTPSPRATGGPGGSSGSSNGGALMGGTTAEDTTPPSGQKVEVAGGRFYRRLAVPLVLSRGTDGESGIDAASGLVERQAAPLADGACGRWSEWHAVALDGSIDTNVADGNCYRYRYRISDRAGNRSSFSPPSGIAAVDTTPPAPPTLSLAEDGRDTIAVGTTLLYRPDGRGGTFVASAASSDHGSGLAAITFPGLAGGMEPGAATRRTAAPYDVTYTWRNGAAEHGTKVVIAVDRAGNTSRANFTITADQTGPDGLSVTVSGGLWFTVTSVPLLVDQGSDSGSGIDPGSVQLERDAAPLADGECGAFADAWTPVSLAGGSDTSVEGGRCYRYRVSVSDNVGNRSTSPPSEDARVDTTPPSPPVLTLHESSAAVSVSGVTVFYRPGAAGSFSVEATADDPESEIAAVSFPALAGASGGGMDESAPYQSGYSWGSDFVAAGSEHVLVSNRAGETADGAFALAPDAVAPAEPRVRLVGGPWFTVASVPLVVEQGSDTGSGVDPGSVQLERDAAPLAGGECGTFAGAWTPVSLAGGADTSVEGGRCYRYRASVSDNVGNRATSPPSEDARVDTTPPSLPRLTLHATAGVGVSDTIVFYGAADGSFTVKVTAEDPESGIAAVSFPALADASGGGADESAPYETDYSWGAGFAATGPQTVTASNGAGLVADTSFTLTIDAEGPTGMSIILLGGPIYTGSTVPFRIVEGTDSGSGVRGGSASVERDSTLLDTSGVCGPFSGTWATLSLPGTADTTIEPGHCYRYRVWVSDNAGNRAVSAPTGDAIVP